MVTGETVSGAAAPDRDQAEPKDRQWLFALLPTFPPLLLILRIWYFSDENIDNTQLLIQDINPIGLIAALLLTLLWMLPGVALVFRLAGSLLRISVDDPSRFRMARISAYIPIWVVTGSVVVASLTWEIQFLPVLLALVLMLANIEAKLRFPANAGLVAACLLVICLGALALLYVLFWPVAQEAIARGDALIGLLLLLPLLALPVSGPLPAAVARHTVNTVALAFALGMSAIVVLEFVKIPILPVMAVEVRNAPANAAADHVLSGYIIAMDERMTTFLDLEGALHFVSNDLILSKTLCRDYSRAPYTDMSLRGLNIEESVLEAGSSAGHARVIDQRCYGRTAGR